MTKHRSLKEVMDERESLFGKEWLDAYILERWQCFGQYNKNNIECTQYCKAISERCRKKKEETNKFDK